MKTYIVYVYLDPRKKGKFSYDEKYNFEYEPFYVGEGISGRHLDHLREALNKKTPYYANRHKFYKIKSILAAGFSPIIEVIFKSELKEEVQKTEIYLISKIGRLDKNTGPLLNLTDGGDINPIMFGSDNPMFGKKWSEERKKAFSEGRKSEYAQLSLEDKDAWKRKMSEIRNTDLYRSRMSQRFSGKGNPRYGAIISPETRKKISLSNIGKMAGKDNPNAKTWKITNNDSEEFIVTGTLDSFCRERNLCGMNLKKAGKKGIPCIKGPSKGWMAVEIKNNFD